MSNGRRGETQSEAPDFVTLVPPSFLRYGGSKEEAERAARSPFNELLGLNRRARVIFDYLPQGNAPSTTARIGIDDGVWASADGGVGADGSPTASGAFYFTSDKGLASATVSGRGQAVAKLAWQSQWRFSQAGAFAHFRHDGSASATDMIVGLRGGSERFGIGAALNSKGLKSIVNSGTPKVDSVGMAWAVGRYGPVAFGAETSDGFNPRIGAAFNKQVPGQAAQLQASIEHRPTEAETIVGFVHSAAVRRRVRCITLLIDMPMEEKRHDQLALSTQEST